MIESRSNEPGSDLGFVVTVSPGIGSLENCTRTYLLILLDSSRSGLALSRLESLKAHPRRQHLDGSINVGGHQYGESIEQLERRPMCFRSGPPHLEPSSESSVSS